MNLRLNPPKKITYLIAAALAIVAIAAWVIGKVISGPPDVAVEGAPILAIAAWLLLAAGNTVKGL